MMHGNMNVKIIVLVV